MILLQVVRLSKYDWMKYDSQSNNFFYFLAGFPFVPTLNVKSDNLWRLDKSKQKQEEPRFLNLLFCFRDLPLPPLVNQAPITSSFLLCKKLEFTSR